MGQNTPLTRQFKDVQGWPDGVNSFLDPQFIKDTQVRWATNAVNKGGIWQTRPGFRKKLQFSATDANTPFGAWWVSAGNPILYPQFFTVFTPTNGTPQGVVIISGVAWYAKLLPNGEFDTLRKIDNISFNPRVRQIYGCEAVKSAELTKGTVRSITPYKVLMLQDGLGRAAYFDGLFARHLNPEKHWIADSTGNTIYTAGYNETRIGARMAWSGNRLWVFNEQGEGHAGDINDPLSFTEENVLTQVPFFNFPKGVTACIDRGASGIQQNLLFVFTETDTYTLWSGIQDRTQWIKTDDFQRKVFSGVGCVAGKSPINHMGLLYWYSDAGIVAFDSFGTVTSTQALPPIDSEVLESKRKMSPNRSQICASSNDAYVLWSVPTGATAGNGYLYNNETQVLDRVTIPVQIGVGSSVPYTSASWQGVWTGVNPVEWSTINAYGHRKTFCLSMDGDGVIRVYEAFQGDRMDDGAPVAWSLETKTHAVTETPFETSNFRHLRVLLERVYGHLGVVGSWKGLRGQFHELLNTSVEATRGSLLVPSSTYTPQRFNTPTVSFTPQFRDIVSRDNRNITLTCQSQNVESDDGDSADRAFSLLLEFTGVGALLAYRMAADYTVNNLEGAVVSPETGLHILPESGCPSYVPSA